MTSSINADGRINLSLAGRTALVCGASSGIGRATARSLAAHGARVVVLARSEERLNDLIKMLPPSDVGEHRAVACDLLDRASLRAKIEAEIQACGSIEIFVANSSGPKSGPITEASEEAFLTTFSQHLLANHLLAQMLLPGMRATGFGRVINIISTSVKMPIPNLGVSNTVRAAVASWAKTLAGEVAAHGITVNSVLPGYTATERLTELKASAAKVRGVTEQQVESEWKNATPMKRFAEPEEIAAAVTFFASPAAGFVTGTALAVDGGRTGCL
jgi:3-oxoacyl-[acyl-carrier protein] reductase